MTTQRSNPLQQQSAQVPDPETARRMVASFEQASQVAMQDWHSQISGQTAAWVQSFGRTLQDMQDSARSIQQSARLVYPVTQQVRDMVSKADQTIAVIEQYAGTLQQRQRETAVSMAEQEEMRRIVRGRAQDPDPRRRRNLPRVPLHTERAPPDPFGGALAGMAMREPLLPAAGFDPEEIERIAEAGAKAEARIRAQQQGGLNFNAIAQSVGTAVQASFQAALQQPGRVPWLGGGIGAQPVFGLPPTDPMGLPGRTARAGQELAQFQLGRVHERIAQLANPVDNLQKIMDDFKEMGQVTGLFGGAVGGAVGRGPGIARLVRDTLTASARTRPGFANTMTALTPAFDALRQSTRELGNAFVDLFKGIAGPAKDIWDRTLGTSPERQGVGGMAYIERFGRPPTDIKQQLAVADMELQLLNEQRAANEEIAEIERRQMALKDEDRTDDERTLALRTQETRERERALRITQREGAIGREMNALYNTLFRQTKDIGSAFRQAFQPVAIAGVAMAGVMTKLALDTANLARQLQTVGAASLTTGVALHQMATGLEAITGLRTAAADLERFERAQRAVNAGLYMGEPPARRLIFAYSALGLTFGDVVEVNEQLYNRLRLLPQALREAHAATLGIPQALVAAINMGRSWNDIQARGVNILEEQQQANYELSQRLALLKNEYAELAAEVGGPMLEVLTGFKAAVFPIISGMADFAGNNKVLVATIIALGVSLATLIPLVSMAATVMSAFTLAKTLVGVPVAIGLLVGAGVLSVAYGAVAAGLAIKMGNDVSAALADATEAGVQKGVENAAADAQGKPGLHDPYSDAGLFQMSRMDADSLYMPRLLGVEPEPAPGLPRWSGAGLTAADMEYWANQMPEGGGYWAGKPPPSLGQHSVIGEGLTQFWQRMLSGGALGPAKLNPDVGTKWGYGDATSGVTINQSNNYYIDGDVDERMMRDMNDEVVSDARHALSQAVRSG